MTKMISKTLFGRLAVALAAALVLFAGLPQPAAHADVAATIKEIKQFDKDGEDGKAIAKLTALESNTDPLVAKELLALAKKAKTDRVAVHCMRMLGTRKDEGFLKALPKMIGDKKTAKEKPERYIGVLKAAALYQSEKLLKPLGDVVKKYIPMDKDLAVPAIEAYGSVQSVAVVEQMIKWLGIVSPSTQPKNEVAREAYAGAKRAIISTLSDLTGLDISDAKTWKETWDKKKKTFKFPDPNAEEVDITTLREHTDSSYGFSLKLPDRKQTDKKTSVEDYVWSFTEPREGVRIQIKALDDTGWEVIRIEIQLHNATRGDFRTPAAMWGWWESQYKETYFSEFSKEPSFTKRKFGGHEWIVGGARGQSGEKFSGWGVCARDVYITQADHMLLYVSSVVRSAASDETKAEAVKIMEGLTFSDG